MPDLRGVKRVAPEEIADATIDALKVPRFDVWAPGASAGRSSALGAAIPRAWREAVSRADELQRVAATDPSGARPTRRAPPAAPPRPNEAAERGQTAA